MTKSLISCILGLTSLTAVATPTANRPIVARKNYLQTSIFGYTRNAVTQDNKVGAVTTSTELVDTDLLTYPQNLELSLYLNSQWAMHLDALLSENTITFKDNNNADIASVEAKKAGSVALGYTLNPSVELGGIIAIQRRFQEKDVANTSKNDEITASIYAFGPYLNFYTELSNFDLEFYAAAAYQTGSAEYKPVNGDSSKGDKSGFIFSATADANFALTETVDYLAGVGIVYDNNTQKTGSNEITTKTTSIVFNLGTVRVKF